MEGELEGELGEEVSGLLEIGRPVSLTWPLPSTLIQRRPPGFSPLWRRWRLFPLSFFDPVHLDYHLSPSICKMRISFIILSKPPNTWTHIHNPHSSYSFPSLFFYLHSLQQPTSTHSVLLLQQITISHCIM